MITDREKLLDSIRGFRVPAGAARPRLLFDAADVALLRQRAAEQSGLLDQVRAQCRPLLAQPPQEASSLQPYVSSAEAATVAEAYVLTGEPAYAEWAKARAAALLELDTWFAPVHRGACRVCDHCMANTAAHLALVHDHLGELYSPAATALLAAGLRRLHFDPFLDGTGDQPEWWFRRDLPSNWKIMTCGDSGLAVCGFAEHWPEANEALARAAQGVLEVLDDVPPEGDWPEGIGYWFATLRLGLRLARALRRLSGGAIDLFRHPALQVTGDFATMLFTPAGRVYHFNDNNPEPGPHVLEPLVMLAAEQRRGDWMRAARTAPVATPLYLACEDPSVGAAPPTRTTACFPTTGVATLRSGWEPDATFVGFKCGPSDVGHSHLDANSFFIEARGRALVIEQSYWPQAHFLGFFDARGPRWNFDGVATVGHSALLVDAQGQTWGPEFPGRIIAVRPARAGHLVMGDASKCYPGLLTKFVRSLLLIGDDTIVIRDVVDCNGERHVEWLLHYAGRIRSEGSDTIIDNQGVGLRVTPFLPGRSQGWRVSDVERTSTYECSDTRQEVTRSIRYRSFAPFRKSTTFEFLFGLQVGGTATGEDWQFARGGGGWTLRAPAGSIVVRPDGDALSAAP